MTSIYFMLPLNSIFHNSTVISNLDLWDTYLWYSPNIRGFSMHFTIYIPNQDSYVSAYIVRVLK